MERVVFEHSKLNIPKLTEYGFKPQNGVYYHALPLLDGQFLLELFVSSDGSVETKLLDTASEDEYVLHLVEACGGAFVAEVRSSYRAALEELRARCYETSVFKGAQTVRLINYMRETYCAEPEFLWEKWPTDCVFRRSDNKKWFAAILTVRRDRLSLAGKEEEEIVDFRADPESLPALIDNARYFGGYHMNKKHWLTVLLNGSVPFEELIMRIDESYRIAKK